jgi:hypothetical protein
MFLTKDDSNCIIQPDPVTNKGGLWVGNFRPSDDIAWLKSMGINYVLTAMPKICAHKPIYKNHGIIQMVADSEDAPGCNISIYFEDAYKFIDNALENGNILVHCGAGISRSTTLAMAWYTKKHGKGFDQSLAFFRTHRPICTPNTGFEKQLRQWVQKWI